MNDLISRVALIDSFQFDDDGTAWTTDDIVYRLEQFPSAEQCDNCPYKHIWITQRMNGNGYFGHGGATA